MNEKHLKITCILIMLQSMFVSIILIYLVFLNKNPTLNSFQYYQCKNNCIENNKNRTITDICIKDCYDNYQNNAGKYDYERINEASPFFILFLFLIPLIFMISSMYFILNLNSFNITIYQYLIFDILCCCIIFIFSIKGYFSSDWEQKNICIDYYTFIFSYEKAEKLCFDYGPRTPMIEYLYPMIISFLYISTIIISLLYIIKLKKNNNNYYHLIHNNDNIDNINNINNI